MTFTWREALGNPKFGDEVLEFGINFIVSFCPYSYPAPDSIKAGDADNCKAILQAGTGFEFLSFLLRDP